MMTTSTYQSDSENFFLGISVCYGFSSLCLCCEIVEVFWMALQSGG